MLFTVNERVISYCNQATPEFLLKSMSVSESVSFFIFPCIKGHSVRASLDTISMTLDKTFLSLELTLNVAVI